MTVATRIAPTPAYTPRIATQLAVLAAAAFVYVTAETSNTVQVIDTSTNAVTRSFSLGVGIYAPKAVAVGPEGHVYVTSRSEYGTVVVIDDRDGAQVVIATIPVGNSSHPAYPSEVAVSPDGSLVYVTNQNDGTVTVIANGQLLGDALTVGANPTGVAIGPDDTAYVTNRNDATVSVIGIVPTTPSGL